MKSTSQILQLSRKNLGIKLKEAAALSGIDQALISKYEHGKRLPSDAHLKSFADAYNIDFSTLEELKLSDKIYEMLRYNQNALEVLRLAESRIEYLVEETRFDVPKLDKELTIQLDRIDALQKQWQSVKPMAQLQLQKMKEYFKVKYTYDSNQIEGNTLTLQETHLVINEGLTIGGKSMREHLEAINHADAVEFLAEVVSNEEHLNERLLLELHSLILKGIDRKYAGSYRDVPVRISGSAHLPPEPYLLSKLMEDFFSHYRKTKRVLHPVILAAEVHERLVSIHPFIDGNGRTARLLMNMVLLQNGYTITSLKGSNDARLKYYRALESVQVNNDSTPFFKLIADEVEVSLKEHLSFA
ncbi:MAG: Fic family protein [Salibacteraceae bacterium]